MYRKTLTSTLRIAAATLTLAALAAPAHAETPNGSGAQVIRETKEASGQPYYAHLSGWWGHEGKSQDTGLGPTYLSLDASDGDGVVSDATIAKLHQALGDGGDFSSLRVAFVPYSADGSNERPTVHQGENAGQAFKWFADLGFGGALNGAADTCRHRSYHVGVVGSEPAFDEVVQHLGQQGRHERNADVCDPLLLGHAVLP